MKEREGGQRDVLLRERDRDRDRDRVILTEKKKGKTRIQQLDNRMNT